jgi:hypothetical protein
MLGKTPALQRKHVKRELVKILGSISYSIALHPPPPPCHLNHPLSFHHISQHLQLSHKHTAHFTAREAPPKNSRHVSQNEQGPNTHKVQSLNEVLDAFYRL